MSLRIRLIFILSAIVIGAAIAGSTAVYLTASAKLREKARQQLTGISALLAESLHQHLNAALRNLEYWAAMPLVRETALNHGQTGTTQAFDDYFSTVAAQEPYSSMYIITREEGCVASDNPQRIGDPYCFHVVRNLPSAQAGFSGRATIGRSTLSRASGQPLVPLTAPIRQGKTIIAILRAGADMGRISKKVLEPLNLSPGETVFLFDPSLPAQLPKSHKPRFPTTHQPYHPPPEALRASFDRRTGPVFRYRTPTGDRLAACAVMKSLPWVIVVTRPMSDILAPVRTLGRITAAIMVLTIIMMTAFILLTTAPVIAGIERCRKFARDIRNNHMDRRLVITTRDEVGALARDLNRMACRIQSTHSALLRAERKYRGIFENAVEGIFQTDVAGSILAANPRLAALIGAPSAGYLVGRSIIPFYADAHQRLSLLNMLREKMEISNVACDFVRMDGIRRQGILHARAELDTTGEITVIHGALEDATGLRQAEAKAQRVRQAEEMVLRTELEMRRYQINPHFLFNSLNAVRELALKSPEQSVKMIEALAEFYHASIAHRFEMLSTLAEEMDRIIQYLNIQKYRFGSTLEVSVAQAPGIEEVPIPIFILQPIVENAVNFGRRSGKRTLKVKIQTCVLSESCRITVANTGRWFSPEDIAAPSGSGLGLEYVRHCLSRLYGDDSGFSIGPDGNWVVAELTLPVQEGKKIA